MSSAFVRAIKSHKTSTPLPDDQRKGSSAATTELLNTVKRKVAEIKKKKLQFGEKDGKEQLDKSVERAEKAADVNKGATLGDRCNNGKQTTARQQSQKGVESKNIVKPEIVNKQSTIENAKSKALQEPSVDQSKNAAIPVQGNKAKENKLIINKESSVDKGPAVVLVEETVEKEASNDNVPQSFTVNETAEKCLQKFKVPNTIVWKNTGLTMQKKVQVYPFTSTPFDSPVGLAKNRCPLCLSPMETQINVSNLKTYPIGKPAPSLPRRRDNHWRNFARKHICYPFTSTPAESPIKQNNTFQNIVLFETPKPPVKSRRQQCNLNSTFPPVTEDRVKVNRGGTLRKNAKSKDDLLEREEKTTFENNEKMMLLEKECEELRNYELNVEPCSQQEIANARRKHIYL